MEFNIAHVKAIINQVPKLVALMIHQNLSAVQCHLESPHSHRNPQKSTSFENAQEGCQCLLQQRAHVTSFRFQKRDQKSLMSCHSLHSKRQLAREKECNTSFPAFL